MITIICSECGKLTKKTHPNKKFCSKRCKDVYHNWNNPRGKYAYLNKNNPDYLPGQRYADNLHPFEEDAVHGEW